MHNICSLQLNQLSFSHDNPDFVFPCGNDKVGEQLTAVYDTESLFLQPWQLFEKHNVNIQVTYIQSFISKQTDAAEFCTIDIL